MKQALLGSNGTAARIMSSNIRSGLPTIVGLAASDEAPLSSEAQAPSPGAMASPAKTVVSALVRISRQPGFVARYV